jgi:hypothetical protein
MERLHPNTRYLLVYRDGNHAIEFQTLDHIPEAKHLIRVRRCDTNEEIELIELLLKPWVDLVKLASAQSM